MKKYNYESDCSILLYLLTLCVQVTGKKGMVIKGKVDKSAFEDIFKDKNIQTDDVQQFLTNMTGDDEG